MAFDIQSALYSSSSVVIPDGAYDVAATIQVPDNSAFGGAMPNGVTINVVTPGIAAFASVKGTDGLATIHACNLTIQTEQADVCGFYTVHSCDNTFRDLKFRGLSHNIRIDQGIMHSLEHLRSYPSPSGARPAGVIMFESSDPTRYVQYLSLENIRSWGSAYSSPLIFHRATNVTASKIHIHEPNQTAILIDDDCQEVEISQAQLVKPVHGVLVAAANGHSPLGVSLSAVAVDQGLDGGFGIYLGGGKDIRISDSFITSNWQGIYISSYPAVERVSIYENHLNENRNNGIFVEAGAQHFRIYENDITGHSGGSGIYVGSGANHFRVIDNDLTEGNLFKFYDASGAVSDKTVSPNFI